MSITLDTMHNRFTPGTVEYNTTISNRRSAMEREFMRFYEGTYKDIPPAVYRALFKAGVIVDWDVFLHISFDDESLIAYSPTDMHLIGDRQLRTRIGRMLNSHDYGELAPWISALYSKEVAGFTLKFAHSAEDIVYVYEHGPESCMGKSTGIFGDVHPVSVYAGSGDLAVAYLTNRAGKISARAVVNLHEKKYNKIYGTAIMADYLREIGYEHSYSALNDCRLSVVKHPSHDNCYLAPYIDNADQSGSLSFCGNWIIIGDESDDTLSLTSTNGWVNLGKWCDSCEEYVDYYIYTASDGYAVCESCLENGRYILAYNSDHVQELVHADYVIYCSLDDEYYTADGFNEFFVEDHEGDTQRREECILCYFTNEYVLEEESVTVLLPDGNRVQAIDSNDDLVYSELYDVYLVRDDAEEGWFYPN